MSEGIARDQLKSIVNRVERLSEEAKSINDDKAEVYKEAKANGFNTKVIKRIVARRNKDAAEADEEDALYDLYMIAISGKSAAGTVSATRAGARTEIAKPAAPVKAAATESELSPDHGKAPRGLKLADAVGKQSQPNTGGGHEVAEVNAQEYEQIGATGEGLNAVPCDPVAATLPYPGDDDPLGPDLPVFLVRHGTVSA